MTKYTGYLFSLCAAIAGSPNVLGGEWSCGIASEFPPYQFSENGEAVGFDADVARLVFERLNEEVRLHQDPWDEVLAEFLFSNKLSCVVGAEAGINREKLFLFSDPYHHRRSAVFVLGNNHRIQRLEDMVGMRVAGDRDSEVEEFLAAQGLKDQLQIRETRTKALAMSQLQSGDVQAAIMPREVGLYLAKRSGVEVRIVVEWEEGSPVAIAVRKNEPELHARINVALRRLIEEGEIDRLRSWWLDAR